MLPGNVTTPFRAFFLPRSPRNHLMMRSGRTRQPCPLGGTPRTFGIEVLRSCELSYEVRDRTGVRRLARKVDFNIINIAPAPTLSWVVALDDGVTRRFEVSWGVTMGRLIAADVPTIATEPQMHPT